ncbi:uncharacterized protein [Coffea arabica]|uniref:Uncharacterized protein LOC113731084 n=1 Tax=Coffea arabica TaxID=13443 RepID=A0A6P6WBG1_COFAR|nr:uncharacterized protein LOC113731084 [Coffea arabica]XP_027111942.1 uncharacterized protein LOC113731084 [Coffea arabica]
MMEKKQLNLNAPLLSVRKPTSNSGSLLSSRNSSANLGSSDGKSRKLLHKSGPIRQHSLPVPKSDWELGALTKPAAVPFVWEQTPGRAKGEGDEQTETTKRSVSAPRLPPGRLPDSVRRYSGERCNDQNIHRPHPEVYPVSDHAALIDSLRESIYGNEESDLESTDDYSDALDALSPTASFSFNCSISGLSGFEVPNVKQSGTFCVDPQTKDLMMSRFLPAAKAAVVETPQYIPKKQPAATEPPKQPRKVVSGERKPLLDHYGSNIISFYNQFAEDVQSEGEDSHRDIPKKRSSKTWGIFPRLCVKKSLCLLNPIPAMKPRTPVPKSPPTDVGRLTRKAYSGPLDKQASDANNKRRFHSGVLSRELHQVENKPSDSRQFSYTSYRAGGLSPCRPSRSGGISPYRNASPQSPFGKGARFLGLHKEVDNVTAEKYSSLYRKCSNLLDAAPPRIYKQDTVSPTEVVEKTLYIDSVTSVNLKKDLPSSKSESLGNSPGENLKISAERKKIEKLSPPYSNGEVKLLDVTKKGNKLDPKSSLLAHEVQPSPTRISNLRGLVDGRESLQLVKRFNEDTNSVDVKAQLEAQTDIDAVTPQSPLNPPLPKSPSESWLWRTLPSVNLRIPFSHSHLGKNYQTKNVDQKASVAGTKWETIVKTSHLRYDHNRYSEENFPRVSHKQNKI